MFTQNRFSPLLLCMMFNMIQSDGIIVVLIPSECLLRCEHIFEGRYTFLFVHYYKFIIYEQLINQR